MCEGASIVDKQYGKNICAPILRVEAGPLTGKTALLKPEFSVTVTDKSTGIVFEGVVQAV